MAAAAALSFVGIKCWVNNGVRLKTTPVVSSRTNPEVAPEAEEEEIKKTRDSRNKKEERERKEQVNRKVASKKAVSVILRREATKAIIEKKRGPTNSKKLLPRTVLEALHERVTALRWESALMVLFFMRFLSLYEIVFIIKSKWKKPCKFNDVATLGDVFQVFELLQEQLWYRPNPGVYIKLIVMLGKCKQPEKANDLFESMIEEGCIVNHESYTALVSAYSRSGLFDRAFSLLDQMKNTR
ncbi:hypothetical protein IFM89_038078, partial [Coptis chinensis]